ncbi:MAG: serine/threonine protein kinase, partial [Bacteroidaceae bacterium]|nr:serine/threonine protein kinase [Bacteroidaceae bacterium]
MNLKAGSQLQGGRYIIDKVLGQGGFGITYLGVQPVLDAKVAIKEFFMKEHCNRDDDTAQVTVGSVGSREMIERFRQKFIKEARSIYRLKHRYIIPVIDVFEENGTAYYVMEYVGGGSLNDKVKEGALTEAVALRYIKQVAAALDFVHSKRMMHLDIKPANILLNENDEAVLIDFGLAKQYDDAGSQTSTTPVGISHGYAPLEQYKRGGVGTFSPATDIYSLGATLYKLLTGNTPPEAGDVNDDGLPALPPTISSAVRNAVETAMQPRRKDRPQSISEFLSLLECHSELSEESLPCDDDAATVIADSAIDNEILHSAQN